MLSRFCLAKWKVLAPPFCWTKFPKKVAKFDTKFPISPKFAPKFFPKFPVLSWQVEKSSQKFTRLFPSEISDLKSHSKSNFTNNLTNTLQVWQPKWKGALDVASRAPRDEGRRSCCPPFLTFPIWHVWQDKWETKQEICSSDEGLGGPSGIYARINPPPPRTVSSVFGTADQPNIVTPKFRNR